MIIRKYWATVKHQLTLAGINEEITLYGGSNVSMEDAKKEALKKVKLIESKIKGEKTSTENYVIEIREELIKEIDSQNLVTRNRYGALVLNSENTIFLDVDEPKYGFFDFFKSFSLKQKKEKAFSQIKKNVHLSKFKDFRFRVYETRKGYRVIVDLSAANISSSQLKIVQEDLFRTFNCDRIYSSLCRKQDCFRARLTPKPSYMKYTGYKVKFPRDENENKGFESWLKGYNLKSQNYSVCHLVLTEGYQGNLSEAVKYHDKICKVKEAFSLA